MAMTSGRMSGVLERMRRVVAGRETEPQSDPELLERFVADGDEAAFTTLVQRHGGMVLGICRRVLRHDADAEDACQATFLVLARQASSIQKLASLASWLHGVAYRVAANLRRTRGRRRPIEGAVDVPQADTTEEVTWRDVVVALDAELNRLPERYRAPLILCYLEGKTRDEAAQELGWSVGTLRGLLERGRDLLRARLTRRGLTLPATLLAVALTEQGASAALPPAVAVVTSHAVLGAASGQVVALAEGVLKTMFLVRVHNVVLTLAVVVALTLGGGLVARSLGGGALPTVNAVPVPAVAALLPGVAAPVPEEVIGPEVRGLRAKIMLPKERFAVGEAIPVTYIVKNVSQEEQILWHSGFWPNHLILVEDAAGKEPPLTESGQQCRNAFSPNGERKKNVRVPVAAGGADAAYEKYDLTSLYDLTRPGRYTVQYVYEEKLGSGWEGRLPSNVVTFEVVAEKVESKPVIADGLSFVALVPKRIPVPAAGGATDVDLGLRVTNVSDKPVTIAVSGVIRPWVYNTVDGRKLGASLAQDGTLRALPPVTLAPGGSWTWRPRAKLDWTMDRATLRLSGPDGLGVPGFWSITTLKVGKHCLFVDYANSNAKQGDVPLWVGKATTEEARFEIVPAEQREAPVLEASKSVVRNDVDFQAVVEPVRPAPGAGVPQAIDLGLRLTNRGKNPLLLDLNMLWPVLKTAEGMPIAQTAVRRLRTAYAAPVVLEPGESNSVLWRGSLETVPGAEPFQLHFVEGTGFPYRFEGLRPGKYRLGFDFEVTQQAANTLAGRYGTLPRGMLVWTGKVATEEVAFTVGPTAQAADSRPIGILVAELESADGGTRLVATKELFSRGQAAISELEKAGARVLSTITPRRVDVVYSLLKGLPDGNYMRNSFGIHLDALASAEDVARMGKQYGFALAGNYTKDARPNCYVTLDQGKKLTEVMQALLANEFRVVNVNLNYVEK
jgi:RNA polymerase sigma factor (sigma-70 family)